MANELIYLAGPAGFAGGAALGLAGFDALRRRALGARRVVAGLAAAVAVLAPAAATGLALWDGALRAALAGGFVLVAGRSRPVWWLPSTALAAAGTVGAGALLGVGLAAAGAALALSLTARRLPLAGTVIAALVVQLALRLEWPRPTGATAALAAAALLPMAVSGLSQSPRHGRRVVRRVLAGVAAFTAVGAGAGIAGALLARADFVAGADLLSAGVDAVRQGDEQATATALTAAGRSFTTARDTLDAAWLLPARLVPVVAQHVSALQRAARTGSSLAVTGAETVAASDVEALGVTDGKVDLERVQALRRPVATAVAALDDAYRELTDATSTRWLIAPLADRLHRERDRVARSRREAGVVLAVTEQLPALLGGDGPRRYFLAIQQPAELRGSGGIIGSYGEVTAEGGRLGIGSFGRDGDLNTLGTPPDQRTLRGPDDYVARYGRFQPQRIWQNVSVSPHFPSVGEVIAGLYPQSGGTAIDGVISVDPFALAALLRLVGPVTVAPWPEPITADNAQQILLFDQYVRLEGTARTDFLGDVAEAVAVRVTAGSLPPPATIVQTLAPAVRGHHLLLWSPSGPEQSLFRRVGADGALPRVGSDALAVVNVNAGGNKLDWFLRRTTDYQAEVDPDGGRVTGTLTVTLRNEAPASGLPDYVIGSSLTGAAADPDGVNRTYLSVFTPLGLSGAALDGEQTLMESEREAGRNVYSLFLVVPPGGSRTLTLSLAGELPSNGPYTLRWRAQPFVVPEVVSARVTAGGDVVAARDAAPLADDVTLTKR